mgnify:CR=1 FL=1
MAFVEFEQRGHVGLITINRPEVLNTLNLEVIEQLDDILLRAESQEDVHVIVITGAGRSFVAGADIGEMVNYTADDAKRFSHHGNNTMMHITRFPSPVIAAVNGFALGGGCELSMACDIRLASEKARFGQPEVGLGITPGFGGTQRLPRIVGVSKAMELILTAKTIKADEAKAIGLVNKVVASEALLDEAKAMMGVIISKAPMAVRYAKVAINKGVNMDLMNGLELEKDVAALAFASEDAKEGTAAFLAKRPAVFQNK